MPEENSITDLWSEIKLLRFKNEGHEKMREWMQKEIDNYKSMQAEMDKLFHALEELGEFTATHLEDMEHYFDNRCVPTVDEVNACAVADSEVRLALGHYRVWKEGQK